LKDRALATTTWVSVVGSIANDVGLSPEATVPLWLSTLMRATMQPSRMPTVHSRMTLALVVERRPNSAERNPRRSPSDALAEGRTSVVAAGGVAIDAPNGE
jgi:hypothetical protein